MPTETTKAVPFLSDADIATRAKGAANHPAIHANEESYGMGARWSRKLYELELQRLRQLVEEARVALVEEYERLESECNEDDAKGRGSFWVRYYRDFQWFLLHQMTKLPKPPQP